MSEPMHQNIPSNSCILVKHVEDSLKNTWELIVVAKREVEKNT